MTRGLGGHSPAHVTHHLQGIPFPARKQDLVKQAKGNGAGNDITDGMPDQEFLSIAEVMKAAGEIKRGIQSIQN